MFGAVITGFLVYNSWDGRFGKLSLSQANRSLIDVHGTFGFFLFFIFIIFVVYCVWFGQKRLVQSDSIEKLTLVGKPIWWYILHRIVNTGTLVAAGLAVVSGKFQDENWLPRGELNHTWYYIHLIAWIVILSAIAIHLLMSVKVGGLPLILSMFDKNYRPADSPTQWFQKIRSWLRRPNF